MLKILREKMGLTQKQLAERIGVTQTYISKIEHGHIRSVTMDKVIKLAFALETTEEEVARRMLDENIDKR
jgi:transcriptional regulator with XRE-family HTH domain